MIIRKVDFNNLKNVLESHSGIKLSESKVSLMRSRLFQRFEQLKLSDGSDYLNYLNANKEELSIFINLMTTNKTEFFRDPEQFEFIRKNIIPKLKMRKKNEDIYIWSAAASTGEEAYSIAILFREEKLKCKVLATDIDKEVLHQAQEGVFEGHYLKEWDKDKIKKHFDSGTGSNSKKYKIKDVLSKNIKFREFNLMEGDYDFPIQFDLVFLKNAFIYFKMERVQEVVNKIYDILPNHGLLLISPSESLMGINNPFKLIERSIFIKEEN